MAFTYSVMLDVADTTALVVGGGSVAFRKIKTLLRDGANVTVIAPIVEESIENLAHNNKITLIKDIYSVEALNKINPFLVFAATNDLALNKEIALYCKKNHILVNSITEPANGSMSVQAKILKQDYAVSISTFGKSPGFSKALREYFENILTPDFDLALKVYLDIRSEILATVNDANQRAEFLHKLELNKIKNFVSEKDDIPYDELLKKVKEWQSY